MSPVVSFLQGKENKDLGCINHNRGLGCREGRGRVDAGGHTGSAE